MAVREDAILVEKVQADATQRNEIGLIEIRKACVQEAPVRKPLPKLLMGKDLKSRCGVKKMDIRFP